MKGNQMIGLVVIDMQQAFELPAWGERNNPQAEEKALAILEAFRNQGRPVVHVQHVSDKPESFFYTEQGQAFKVGFEPVEKEAIFQKQVNSAFIGTDLEAYLRKAGINHVVILGLTLPHCVSTTTRMAANLGFQVTLVADATATFVLPDLAGKLLEPELLHQINLASLQGEFAQVIDTKEVLKLLEHD